MMTKDEMEPEGKIINDSFSTRCPKIKASRGRLLRYHPEINLLFKITLCTLLAAVTFVALSWLILAILTGILLIGEIWLLRFATTKQAEIYENALLTPGIIVTEKPIEVVVLANMNTGYTDGPIWATQLYRYKQLPLTEIKKGGIVPCVSGFQGDEIEKYERFTAGPLSFATKDIEAIKRNSTRFEEDELKLLQTLVSNGNIPTEEGIIAWPESNSTDSKP